MITRHPLAPSTTSVTTSQPDSTGETQLVERAVACLDDHGRLDLAPESRALPAIAALGPGAWRKIDEAAVLRGADGVTGVSIPAGEKQAVLAIANMAASSLDRLMQLEVHDAHDGPLRLWDLPSSGGAGRIEVTLRRAPPPHDADLFVQGDSQVIRPVALAIGRDLGPPLPSVHRASAGDLANLTTAAFDVKSQPKRVTHERRALAPADAMGLRKARSGDVLQLKHTFPGIDLQVVVDRISSFSGQDWVHVHTRHEKSAALRQLANLDAHPARQDDGSYHYTIPLPASGVLDEPLPGELPVGVPTVGVMSASPLDALGVSVRDIIAGYIPPEEPLPPELGGKKIGPLVRCDPSQALAGLLQDSPYWVGRWCSIGTPEGARVAGRFMSASKLGVFKKGGWSVKGHLSIRTPGTTRLDHLDPFSVCPVRGGNQHVIMADRLEGRLWIEASSDLVPARHPQEWVAEFVFQKNAKTGKAYAAKFEEIVAESSANVWIEARRDFGYWPLDTLLVPEGERPLATPRSRWHDLHPMDEVRIESTLARFLRYMPGKLAIWIASGKPGISLCTGRPHVLTNEDLLGHGGRAFDDAKTMPSHRTQLHREWLGACGYVYEIPWP